MGSQKRKRESYATPTSNDAEAASNTPETSQLTTQVTNVPFKVEFVKPGDVKPKKRRTSGKEKVDYNDHTAVREEAGITAADKPIKYVIIPGSAWESMKKYKNFIVSEKQFGVNDYVYVNYGQVAQGEETEDDKQFWIARVLEVRASSPSAVFLRVFWMYWPSELPAGPEYYHGKNELVASNHMEIIDAMTVSGKAEVMHLIEKDDAPTVTGLYWRQKYDFLTRKVSTLKRDCICKQYHNPDKLLIHCVNPTCGKWMHEDCIVNDASERAWASLTKPKISEEPGSDTIEVNGDAENEETIQVATKGSESSGTPVAVNGTKSKPGRGHWKRKSKGKKADLAESTWAGKIEAKLEKQPPAEGEDESTEITGKVILKDLRDEDSKTWDEPATCLFCHAPLQ